MRFYLAPASQSGYRNRAILSHMITNHQISLRIPCARRSSLI